MSKERKYSKKIITHNIIHEDPKLHQKFLNADQISGDGMVDLIAEMIKTKRSTGADIFAWQSKGSQKK